MATHFTNAYVGYEFNHKPTFIQSFGRSIIHSFIRSFFAYFLSIVVISICHLLSSFSVSIVIFDKIPPTKPERDAQA